MPVRDDSAGGQGRIGAGPRPQANGVHDELSAHRQGAEQIVPSKSSTRTSRWRTRNGSGDIPAWTLSSDLSRIGCTETRDRARQGENPGTAAKWSLLNQPGMHGGHGWLPPEIVNEKGEFSLSGMQMEVDDNGEATGKFRVKRPAGTSKPRGDWPEH